MAEQINECCKYNLWGDGAWLGEQVKLEAYLGGGWEQLGRGRAIGEQAEELSNNGQCWRCGWMGVSWELCEDHA